MNKKELNKIVQERSGLNVKLKNDTPIPLNLVYLTLKNRGIKNPSEFIKPTNFTKTPINNIQNINNVGLIEEYIKQDKHIGVLVDVDTDGMMSSAMLINYIKDVYDYDNITPILPDGKIHGIHKNYDLIENLHNEKPFDLIISPDSSSNDLKAIHNLQDKNIEVLVIDHHIINLSVENEAPNFIINNQSSFNEDNVNTNFTGAGMVYECLKYLDNKNSTNYAKNYLDLFSIGQIGDMSDISNLEIRSLMLKGFSHVHNKLIKRYVNKNNIHMSPKALQFSIIPLINSINRIGSHEDRMALFNALIENNENTYYIKKRKIVDHHFKYIDLQSDVYDYAIHQMEQNKKEQKKTVNKALKEAKWLSTEKDNFNMVIIPKSAGGVSGLIANQIMANTKKPSFVVKEEKMKTRNASLDNVSRKLSGSMRIPMQYTDNLELLRKNLDELHSLIFVQGHENASGISFFFKNDNHMKATFKVLNQMYRPIKEVHEVDKYLINDTPSPATFYGVDESLYCFGGEIKEPKMAILGLKVDDNNFKINGKTLHIRINGIDFIKFNLTEDELQIVEDKLDEGEYMYVDMVGTLGINRFLGKESPQFIMEDMKFSTEITNYEEEFIF